MSCSIPENTRDGVFLFLVRWNLWLWHDAFFFFNIFFFF
jgi:hypothetical protein